MKFLIAIVNLLVPILAASLFKTNPDWRIFNGRFANEGEFKYQISLRISVNNSHTCGGSIIRPNWILTAAHCVYEQQDQPSFYYVVAGTNYLDNNGDKYNISNIIVHEKFILIEDQKNFKLQNDVALLHLSTQIKRGPKVELIELQGGYIGDSHSSVISGWGATVLWPFTQSFDLKCATVQTISCQEFVSPQLTTKSNICTRPTGTDSGSVWKGDSGGPLVSKETNKQIGIASFTEPCYHKHVDVYVRISTYKKWIDNTIAHN